MEINRRKNSLEINGSSLEMKNKINLKSITKNFYTNLNKMSYNYDDLSIILKKFNKFNKISRLPKITNNSLETSSRNLNNSKPKIIINFPKIKIVELNNIQKNNNSSNISAEKKHKKSIFKKNLYILLIRFNLEYNPSKNM